MRRKGGIQVCITGIAGLGVSASGRKVNPEFGCNTYEGVPNTDQLVTVCEEPNGTYRGSEYSMILGT